MPDDHDQTTPLGRQIVAGLEGLRDALEAGKPLEGAFRVRDVNKETGERVECTDEVCRHESVARGMMGGRTTCNRCGEEI